MLEHYNKPCIYTIFCKETGYYYIGSTKQPFYRKINSKQYNKGRWSQHLMRFVKDKHIKPLQKSWNEYGNDTIVFSIIETFKSSITPYELLDKEQKYLDEHYGKKLCVNVSPKALRPFMPNEYKHSICTKKKISSSLKSHPVNEATKAKIRSKLLNKKTSCKTKKKISLANKNKTFSKVHKTKLSESQKGNKNSMFGVVGKNHPCSKIQPFYVVNIINDKSYKFDYIFEAVQKFNLQRENLLAVLNKRRKTVNGYTAHYI